MTKEFEINFYHVTDNSTNQGRELGKIKSQHKRFCIEKLTLCLPTNSKFSQMTFLYFCPINVDGSGSGITYITNTSFQKAKIHPLYS